MRTPDRDASWSTGSVDLTPFVGQRGQIRIRGADVSAAGFVEAGVDSVSIKQV